MKYAVLIIARRGSLGGVAHRVRHDRPVVEWASLAKVGIPSRHPSVRSVRLPPSIANSLPSARSRTTPPGCAVPVTGAGPQGALHCWTVKVSVTALMFHEPSTLGRAVSPALATHGRKSQGSSTARATVWRATP